MQTVARECAEFGQSLDAGNPGTANKQWFHIVLREPANTGPKRGGSCEGFVF
jgi:hypothetical protein